MRASAVVALAFVAFMGFSERADAQFFRNQGIGFSLGYLGLGTGWDRVLNEGRAATADDAGWNIHDQPTIGAGYFRAIGYQLWFDGSAVIGASTTIISNEVGRGQPVITLAISTGIRYVFLEERVRPYVGANIQYLQLIALAGSGVTAEIPGNGFLGNTPFFIGLRPCGGVEFVFGDEQSVQLDVGLVGFLVPDQTRGVGSLFLPATVARASYNIYF